ISVMTTGKTRNRNVRTTRTTAMKLTVVASLSAALIAAMLATPAMARENWLAKRHAVEKANAGGSPTARYVGGHMRIPAARPDIRHTARRGELRRRRRPVYMLSCAESLALNFIPPVHPLKWGRVHKSHRASACRSLARAADRI